MRSIAVPGCAGTWRAGRRRRAGARAWRRSGLNAASGSAWAPSAARSCGSKTSVHEFAGAGRAECAEAAGLPAAEGGDHAEDVTEAAGAQAGSTVSSGQHRGRLRSSGSMRIRRRGPRLEDFGVALPHAGELLFQQGGETSCGVRTAQEGGEAREFGRLLGHGVRLAIRHHLQAMLDAAQDAIGHGQLRGGAAAELAAAGEAAQGAQRGGLAQAGVAAAPDELQGLGGELDLADAALGRA